MTSEPKPGPWTPARAAARLADGVLPAVQPEHPRIERCLRALRRDDPAAAAECWDEATADRVTILCAHFGVPQEFFTDSAVAEDVVDETAFKEELRRHGVGRYTICRGAPASRCEHRRLIRELLTSLDNRGADNES